MTYNFEIPETPKRRLRMYTNQSRTRTNVSCSQVLRCEKNAKLKKIRNKCRSLKLDHSKDFLHLLLNPLTYEKHVTFNRSCIT